MVYVGDLAHLFRAKSKRGLLAADFLFGGSNFRHEYLRMELCFMYVKCMLRAFMLVPRDTLRPLILQNSVRLRFHGFPAELWPLGPSLGRSPSPANTGFLL